MRKPQSGIRLDATAALPAAEFEHMAVPDEVARIRVLGAALLWGWPWAVAHGLYAWAVADFAFCVLSLYALRAAVACASPTSIIALIIALSCWLTFRAHISRRGATEAWRRRAFRDAAEFHAVQTTWTVAAGVCIAFFVLLAIQAPLVQDILVSPACSSSG